MEDARLRSNRMLEEYSAALEKTFAEHQQDARRRADMQLEHETEKIEREINKQLSIEQLGLKRQLGHALEELKDKLFVELRDRLDLFMTKPEYVKLLEKQIEGAIAFAGAEELTVFIDPLDEDKLPHLTMKYGTAILKISEYSFGGGTRALLPSRRILIDNSFHKKLAEAKEAFHFNIDKEKVGGTTHG